MSERGETARRQRSYLLPLLMLSGAALGFVIGGAFGKYWAYPEFGFWTELIKLFGDLFMNLLKMVVVPLIVCSMVVGIASLGDFRRIGGAFGWTVAYYVSTTLISVALGIILVSMIKPGLGVGTEVEVARQLPAQVSWYEALFDVVRGMVPSNIVKAAAEGQVLGLIIASLLFGGILTTLGERGRRIVELVDIVNDAIMRLVRLVIWLAPLGIFGLVATKIGEAGGGQAVVVELKRLVKYALTVIAGLIIHAGVILPTILFVLGGRNPLKYVAHYIEALLTAFTTASSAATLPITMRDAQQKAGLSERSSGFVLPLGATINMDGTALYEAVAVIFICQAYGVDLGFAQLLIVWLTATLAAIGAAAIPEAGLVTMVMVLTAVGAPLEGIGLLLAIDWFLDRCRTTVNVWGDTIGAQIVDRLLKRYPETGAVPEA